MENKETAPDSLAVFETRQDIAGDSTETTSSTAAAQDAVTQTSSSNIAVPLTAICPICGEDLKDLPGYYTHSISFHRQCPWCKEDFTNGHAMKKHLLQEPCKSLCTEDILASCFDKRFICLECYGKGCSRTFGTFATVAALENHTLESHGSTSCPDCNKVCTNKRKLDKHLWRSRHGRFRPGNENAQMAVSGTSGTG